MMKFRTLLSFFVLLLASGVGRANLLYNVTLDTGSLAASSSGPFAIDVQVNDGGTPNTNTAQLTNFLFGGGSPFGSPVLSGGATGSLSSSVQVSDTNFLNEFTQSFNPGSFLSFDLALSTIPDPSGTPDEFSFAILDANVELTTTSFDSLGTSVILLADLTGDSTSLLRYGSATGAAITFAPPDVVAASAVPEPSMISMALLVVGLGAGWFKTRKRY